nr:reverse transcriptase domain-containing protein [Tanacetum cinerariifolium]
AGRATAAAQGGRIGERTGRGGGKTRGRYGVQGNHRIDGQGVQVCGQGNEGDVRNVIMNKNRKGCTYNEFLACNPKEYDGKGGAIVYTHWIEKMESVQDISGCEENQKVKYITVRSPILPPCAAAVARPALHVVILGSTIYTKKDI